MVVSQKGNALVSPSACKQDKQPAARPSSKLRQKFPEQLQEFVADPPSLRLILSFLLITRKGRASASCHCLCQVPPRGVFSSLGIRGKRMPTSTQRRPLFPTRDGSKAFQRICLAKYDTGEQIANDWNSEIATMPKMAPSSATLKPARLSRRPSKRRSVPMAATKSSSTTCRR